MNDKSDVILQEPPVAGNEADTLLGALERQRRYLAWKCGNLDSAGLQATHAPSTMTLGGLIKHLALVEDEYFWVTLAGRPRPAPWDGVDFDADPNWEWRTAADDSPDQLMALWEGAVGRSRAVVAETFASGGELDQLVSVTSPSGHTPSVRRVIMDMIEEYARHVGHADLIRESVDGLVGEDPA
jgi:hypothetical protein